MPAPTLFAAHLRCTGPKAVTIGMSALPARFHQAGGRVIYLRNADLSGPSAQGIRLDQLNLLTAPVLGVGTCDAIRRLLQREATPEETPIFLRWLALWDREPVAASRTMRAMDWIATKEQADAIDNLCAIHRVDIPVERSIADPEHVLLHVPVPSLDLVFLARATGARPVIPADLQEHLMGEERAAVAESGLNLAMEDVRDVVAGNVLERACQVLYDRAPIHAACVVGARTNVGLLARLEEALPELVGRVRSSLGGDEQVPRWWSEPWVTLTCRPIQGSRLLLALEDIWQSAQQKREDAPGAPPFYLLVEPGLVPEKSPQHSGLCDILRLGRKEGLWVTIMDQDGISADLATHCYHTLSDRPLRGNADPTEPDTGRVKDRIMLWLTTRGGDASIPMRESAFPSEEILRGRNLVDSHSPTVVASR